MTAVTVATLNLFNRMGRWEARGPLVVQQLLELEPDVIALQEVDMMLDQGAWLQRQVNEQRAGSAPYEIKHAASPGLLAAYHGIATLAKIAYVEHEVLDLMSFGRTAQRSVFAAGGRHFAFVNTHLHHPPDAAEERLREGERLLRWLDRHPPLPTVVAGDFNAYPGEPVLAIMKGRFRSAYEVVHGRKPDKTWPTPVNTDDPSPPGALDYIFVSPEFAIEDAGLAFDRPSPDDAELFPSDHLGLFARLSLA